jgi:hypothetical protein
MYKVVSHEEHSLAHKLLRVKKLALCCCRIPMAIGFRQDYKVCYYSEQSANPQHFRAVLHWS